MTFLEIQKKKNKEFIKFLIFWGDTEHFIFNDRQTGLLQSDPETTQLPGGDSGESLLSQLNQSDCFRSCYNPQETCISNEPQHKARAPNKPQALQMRKRKKISWPFPDIPLGKHWRKGSTHFQMEKSFMRTESGPRTRTDQNQTEWHQSRRLIAVREKPAWLCHEIRNTWSTSEPLGDSKPFQATEKSKKKRDEYGRDSLTVPSSHAGTEMDPKDFRKGHKHLHWLLCSTTRTCVWLMGLRKPREAVSLCQKQATCKDRRDRS